MPDNSLLTTRYRTRFIAILFLVCFFNLADRTVFSVLVPLIREDLQTTTNQIPFLGNLPLVGPAFRQKTENVDRTEIIVLITPRIISDPLMSKEGAQLGNDREDLAVRVLPRDERCTARPAMRPTRPARSSCGADGWALPLLPARAGRKRR